jgi:hypothetical protein
LLLWLTLTRWCSHLSISTTLAAAACWQHVGSKSLPASSTLVVTVCTHQLARVCMMPRSAAMASLAGALVSCSTFAVTVCRLRTASTRVTLHVALWLTRWCLHLVCAASQLHAGSHSVHASARSCVLDAALRRCGFARCALVSCSTHAVVGCRQQIASTCVMLRVAAVTHAHALELSSPSWVHTCSRSMQAADRSRVMPRFAAVALLAGALVSCSTRHARSHLVQAADCFHVRAAPRRFGAHTLVPSSRACSQPASH